MWRLLFFLLVGGWGEEEGGVRTIPSYLLLLNRHHGRTRYVEHVHGHELQWPGPRDNCARSGVRERQQRAGACQIESDFLRFGHGGTDPVCGPRRLLPFAAGSGRPVLAFLPLLLTGFLFLLRTKPGIVPRARLLAHSPVFGFPHVSSSLSAPSPRTWKH
jgi:hypothetical protein